MSQQADIREAFAELLSQHLDIPIAVFVPGTLRTATGYLQHSSPYMDFRGDGATFGRPAMLLSLVLVSPVPDWDRAMTWVDEKVELLRAIPPTLIAGRHRPQLSTVNALGVLDNKALAFEITFTPIQLGALA